MDNKNRHYNVAFIRKRMKEYSGGEYRLAKDTPAVVAEGVDIFIKTLTFNSIEFAMNGGRSTIMENDVRSALKLMGVNIGKKPRQKPSPI